MIEPTESESKEELDLFIDAMKSIAEEAEQHPEIIAEAPHNTRISRLDETMARESRCCAGSRQPRRQGSKTQRRIHHTDTAGTETLVILSVPGICVVKTAFPPEARTVWLRARNFIGAPLI